MIDIEKFICSLLEDHPKGVTVRSDIHKALKKQGLEYKDGKIVPIEDKESEDEKIRKWCISHFRECFRVTKDNVEYQEYLNNKVIPWLERWGEKKSIWHNEDEEPQRGNLILLIMQSGTPIVAKIIEPNHTFNHGERWAYIDDLLERQGEPEPVGKVEPKFRVGDVIRLKGGAAEYTIKKVTDTTYYTNGWSCDIERCEEDYELVEQTSTWSEDDEKVYNRIYDIVHFAAFANCDVDEDGKECGEYAKIIGWFKSLKDRVGCETNCTTMWKPSREQMKYLHKYAEQNNYDGAILTGLYDDLLKIYNLNNHDKN